MDWVVRWIWDGCILRSPVCVSEGLYFIWVKGKLYEGFNDMVLATRKFDAYESLSSEVMDGILTCINVTRRAFMIVLGKYVGYGGEIGTDLCTDPVEGSYKFLELFV